MANFPKELWDKVSSAVIPPVQKMFSALGEMGLGAFKTTSQKGDTSKSMGNDEPPSSPSVPTQNEALFSGSNVSDPKLDKPAEEKQKIPGSPLLTKYEKERIFAKGILELAGQRGPNDPVLPEPEAETKIIPEPTTVKETPKPS